MSEGVIRVLVIDDSEAQSVLVEGQLDLVSQERPDLPVFEVVAAPRLSAGFDHLERQGADVVLLDLSLPDSFEVDTVARFCERFPDVPAIVQSGSSNPGLEAQVLALGARAFVPKSRMDGEALATLIISCVRRPAA